MFTFNLSLPELAMTSKLLRCHSRESGNLATKSVHPELVEGFFRFGNERFDKLTMPRSPRPLRERGRG